LKGHKGHIDEFSYKRNYYKRNLYSPRERLLRTFIGLNPIDELLMGKVLRTFRRFNTN
jgi:hypothetical protein